VTARGHDGAGTPLDLGPAQFARLSQLLDEAIERPAETRESWLADLERREPEIAVLLRDLLASEAACQAAGFLVSGDALARTGPELGTHPGLIGKQIGPYRVLSLIGRGGMGSVWLAERVDGLFFRQVALKLVHPVLMGRGIGERLARERAILATLNHPNIAQLLDAGFAEDGQPYLALEYVLGSPLTAYCDERRLSIRERLRLFQQVLNAVQYAHAHLVIHRDLKPSNILVTEHGRVELLDFGIAKLLTEGAAKETELTQVSGRALTPDYAAPEQIAGRPLTTAADVYALGVILYELLVGERPYRLKRDSRGALEEAILEAEPVPPSRAALTEAAAAARDMTVRKLAKLLQGDLDTIVSKALRKAPGERYATADAFSEDIERFLRGDIVLAQRDSLTYRVLKFTHRHRAAVAGSLLVGSGLIATSVFALVQMFDSRAQRDLAVSQAKRAEGQADLSEFLIGDSLKQVPDDAIRKRLQRAREFVARRFRDDPTVEAQLLLVVADRYIDLGDDRTASEVTRAAEAIAQRLRSPELSGELACLRAEYLAIGRDLGGARTQLKSGLESIRRLQLIPPALTAECAGAEAFVAEADGDFTRAAAALRKAVNTLEHSGWYGSSPFISTSSDLARALTMAGDFHGAWEVQSRIISLTRDLGRGNTSGYYAMVNVGCTILRDGGQPHRAVELVDSVLKDAHGTAADVDFPSYLKGSRAMAEIVAGGSEQAVATLLQAADSARRSGALYWTLFQALLVTAALDHGDLQTADARWLALAPVEEQMLATGQRGIDTVRLLLVHARLEIDHGRSASAARLLDRAAGLIASRGQPTNPDARVAELLRARLLFMDRAYQEAAVHAGRAVQLARAGAVDPQSSAWVGEALLWQARAESALGRGEVAAATARAALDHLLKNVDAANPLISAAQSLAESR